MTAPGDVQQRSITDLNEQELGLQGEGITIHSQYQSIFHNLLIRKLKVAIQRDSSLQAQKPKGEETNERVKCIDLRQFVRKKSEKATSAVTYSSFKQKQRQARDHRDRLQQLEKGGCVLSCPVDTPPKTCELIKFRTLKQLPDGSLAESSSKPTGVLHPYPLKPSTSTQRIKFRRLFRRNLLLNRTFVLGSDSSDNIKVDGLPVKPELAERRVRERRSLNSTSFRHYASMQEGLKLSREALIRPKLSLSRPDIPKQLRLGMVLDQERIAPWEGEY